jgi:hypothetical protein
MTLSKLTNLYYNNEQLKQGNLTEEDVSVRSNPSLKYPVGKKRKKSVLKAADLNYLVQGGQL